MKSLQTSHLTVSLGGKAHEIARQFAAEHPTPQKGKQIYLNTLAVYAVHLYLRWLQIETDLWQGESWHPGKQVLFDVADLVLPGIGKLECRPILPGETEFCIPLETRADRLGYVAVQLDEPLREARLLGFLKAVDLPKMPERVSLAALQPLETLLDCLEGAVAPVSHSKRPVNLSHWLHHTFEAGWQTIEALITTQPASFAFSARTPEQTSDAYGNEPAEGVSGGKLIDLGVQLAGHRVALIVTITPKADREVDIRLRVCPASGQIYLPPNLQLTVWDESGTQLEAEARSDDNWLQLEFSGERGERFSAQLALGEIRMIEDFVI